MTQPEPDEAPTDPEAIGALVAGILGLALPPLGIVAGPVAIVLGQRAKRRIADSGEALGGAGIAKAGFILGIISTVLVALGIILFGLCLAALSSMGY